MFAVDSHAAPPRSAPAALAVAFTLALTLATPMAADAAQALRVVRDPVTGELRGPNAAEAAAFEKAEAQLRLGNSKAQPAKTPVEIHHPDGTVETKLGDDTMMYSVVRASEDGSLTMACLPAKQAQAFMKATSAKKTSAVKAKTKVGHSHE